MSPGGSRTRGEFGGPQIGIGKSGVAAQYVSICSFSFALSGVIVPSFQASKRSFGSPIWFKRFDRSGTLSGVPGALEHDVPLILSLLNGLFLSSEQEDKISTMDGS